MENLNNSKPNKGQKDRTCLVLTREVEQKIYIGNDIEVVVCGIKDNKVKLGIYAPPDVPILRDNAIKKFKQPYKNAS